MHEDDRAANFGVVSSPFGIIVLLYPASNIIRAPYVKRPIGAFKDVYKIAHRLILSLMQKYGPSSLRSLGDFDFYTSYV